MTEKENKEGRLDTIPINNILKNHPINLIATEYMKHMGNIRKSFEQISQQLPIFEYFQQRNIIISSKKNWALYNFTDELENLLLECDNSDDGRLSVVLDYYSKDNYCHLIEATDCWTKEMLVQDKHPILQSIQKKLKTITKENEKDIANILIPIIYSQIDGIIIKLMRILNKKPAKNKYFKIDDKKDFIQNELISEDTPFRKVTDEQWALLFLLDNFFDGEEMNNRNGILHGENNDYGTFEHLIRSVNLLGALISILPKLINKQKDNKTMTNPTPL